MFFGIIIPKNIVNFGIRALFQRFSPTFSPYLMGAISVLKTDIKKCDSTALTTYFYIVRAVLLLKFETIYRIERYIRNPIFLLIIIHGDAIGLL